MLINHKFEPVVPKAIRCGLRNCGYSEGHAIHDLSSTYSVKPQGTYAPSIRKGNRTIASLDWLSYEEGTVQAFKLVNAANAYDALVKALDFIVTNAVMIPDASRNGATDIFTVPLDDIQSASELLAQLRKVQK